jgi:hypothetical protein
LTRCRMMAVPEWGLGGTTVWWCWTYADLLGWLALPITVRVQSNPDMWRTLGTAMVTGIWQGPEADDVRVVFRGERSARLWEGDVLMVTGWKCEETLGIYVEQCGKVKHVSIRLPLTV